MPPTRFCFLKTKTRERQKQYLKQRKQGKQIEIRKIRKRNGLVVLGFLLFDASKQCLCFLRFERVSYRGEGVRN